MLLWEIFLDKETQGKLEFGHNFGSFVAFELEFGLQLSSTNTNLLDRLNVMINLIHQMLVSNVCFTHDAGKF